MMQVTLMALEELAWLTQVGKATGGVGHVPVTALEVERYNQRGGGRTVRVAE